MATPKRRAEDLLVHYFATAFRAAGLIWDSDNDSEVRQIIDAIDEMTDDSIRAHCENEPHLHRDGSSY